MKFDRFAKANPIPVLAAVLVLGGLLSMIAPALPGMGGSDELPDCVLDATGACVPGLPESSVRLYPTSPGPVMAAEDACRDVAYLCAALEAEPRILIKRWRDFSGTIIVHIPLPRMDDAVLARRLQRAAAAGVRLWNGQPFEILVDDRGTREAHFAVQWNRGVSGNQIGVARTQWTPDAGLKVVSLQLATRNPFAPSRIIDPGQIRLTAMHEMGHALGLPHSDSPRDVMYPTNTATTLSAQDYVAMEALYAMEDGTEIVR